MCVHTDMYSPIFLISKQTFVSHHNSYDWEMTKLWAAFFKQSVTVLCRGPCDALAGIIFNTEKAS